MSRFDVDPTNAAPRDFDIETVDGQVRADGFLHLILGDTAAVSADGHHLRMNGFRSLLPGAVRQCIDDLPVRSGEPPETTLSLQSAGRLVHCLPVTDAQPPCKQVITQRLVADRVEDSVCQGRHDGHRRTGLRHRSNDRRTHTHGKPPPPEPETNVISPPVAGLSCGVRRVLAVQHRVVSSGNYSRPGEGSGSREHALANGRGWAGQDGVGSAALEPDSDGAEGL